MKDKLIHVYFSLPYSASSVRNVARALDTIKERKYPVNINYMDIQVNYSDFREIQKILEKYGIDVTSAFIRDVYKDVN